MKIEIDKRVEENSDREKCKIAESTMRSLPQWFGRETALVGYVKEIKNLPTIVARSSDRAVGFLSFKEQNCYAAELVVMGIYPEFHRPRYWYFVNRGNRGYFAAKKYRILAS